MLANHYDDKHGDGIRREDDNNKYINNRMSKLKNFMNLKQLLCYPDLCLIVQVACIDHHINAIWSRDTLF